MHDDASLQLLYHQNKSRNLMAFSVLLSRNNVGDMALKHIVNMHQATHALNTQDFGTESGSKHS